MLQVELNHILTEEDALGKIKEIFEKVEREKEIYVVTKDGRPMIAIVDIDHLEKDLDGMTVTDEPSPMPGLSQAPAMTNTPAVSPVAPSASPVPPVQPAPPTFTPPAPDAGFAGFPPPPPSFSSPAPASFPPVMPAPTFTPPPAAPAMPPVAPVAPPTAPGAGAPTPPATPNLPNFNLNGSLDLPNLPEDPGNSSPLA